MNYFAFEDTFRGPVEEIKKRQSAFLQYFEGCKNVLDIGCGRGEFLQLMKERGVGARGVDIDEDMVNYCRSRGYDVHLGDAVSYLETLDDKSLDGIFIDQVVEHLEPDYLSIMLHLCYRKLKYGYHLVAETINPASLVAFSNYFYMDMSHKKPLHPATLRFLFSSVGFRDINILYLSPVPEENKLRRVQESADVHDDKRHVVETYNHNIDVLNNILFSPQDYALIGKK